MVFEVLEVICVGVALYSGSFADSAHSGIKSVLGRVHNLCMLVLRLCCVMVASQLVVDTRQMLYKYMILCKHCGHWLLSNTTGCSPGGAAHTRHSATHLQPQAQM